MKKGLNLSKEQLEELYTVKKLSLSKIGKIFDCKSTNVLYWLKKHNINRRPAYFKKIYIPKKDLYNLYWIKKLSSREIAKIYSIKSGRTIRKKLEIYGIKRKSVSEALTKKFKKSFCGNLKKKAFLLGLRAGDFHAKKIKKSVRIQTSTTHKAQIELLERSFHEYGEIRKYLYKSKEKENEWFIYVDMNESFYFLVPKPTRVPEWIINNNSYFYQFLAAYSDCEGNFNINRSHKNCFRVSFRLRTGDKNILEDIKNKLEEENYSPLLNLETKKGTIIFSYHSNKDIYNLTLNKKEEVLKFIQSYLPLSKHSEKMRKMKFILEMKSRKWKYILPKLKILRQEIKKEILKI